jgi:hypothetical protein
LLTRGKGKEEGRAFEDAFFESSSEHENVRKSVAANKKSFIQKRHYP